MNILALAHDSSMYGASQSLLTALAGIVKKNHRKVLVLLSYPGKMEDALGSAGIDYEIVPFPLCMASHEESKSFIDRSRNVYNCYKQSTLISPQLEKITRRFKADVIYTNTSVVAAGYKVARRLHIPHVWHVRGMRKAEKYSTRNYVDSIDCILHDAAVDTGTRMLREHDSELACRFRKHGLQQCPKIRASSDWICLWRAYLPQNTNATVRALFHKSLFVRFVVTIPQSRSFLPKVG